MRMARGVSRPLAGVGARDRRLDRRGGHSDAPRDAAGNSGAHLGSRELDVGGLVQPRDGLVAREGGLKP